MQAHLRFPQALNMCCSFLLAVEARRQAIHLVEALVGMQPLQPLARNA
jgi:hypothetical protein